MPRQTPRSQYKATKHRRRRRVQRKITGVGKIHTFRQGVAGGLMTVISTALTGNNIVQSSLANIYTSFAFTLNDIPQVATFTALFDMYKIDKVVMTIYPQSMQTNSGANVVSENLGLYVLDYDDAASLPSYSAGAEYENVKYFQVSSNKPIVITVKPRIAMAAYNGAFTGYANTRAQWIDCGSPGVQHYGIKVVVPIGAANYLQNFYVNSVYYFSFKNVR